MNFKRYHKYIALALVVALCFMCVSPPQAHAEALTIAIIAGAAAAIAVASGLAIVASQSDSSSLSTFWENKVNNYLAGRTIPQVFGDEVCQAVSGKLLIPATLYGHLVDFVNDATSGIGTTPTVVYDGADGFDIADNLQSATTLYDAIDLNGYYIHSFISESGNNKYVNLYIDPPSGSPQGSSLYGEEPLIINGIALLWSYKGVSSGNVRAVLRYSAAGVNKYLLSGTYVPDVPFSSSSWAYPDGKDILPVTDTQTWQGTVGGYSGPDTNLEQLLGHLFDEMADNNLEVEGEAIDTPVPPAPEPVLDLPFPNTIAGDFLEGLNDLLQDAAQGLENVGTGISQGISQGIGIVQQGLRDILGEISAFKQLLLQVTGDIANDLSLVAEAALQIPQILQNILVDTGDILSHLLEDIELAPVQLFDAVLDVLKNILQPLLNRLRAGVGIWHYVVEWFSSISVPFYWVIAVTSQTGILTPAYALIAGSIVIAVYRRFGR